MLNARELLCRDQGALQLAPVRIHVWRPILREPGILFRRLPGVAPGPGSHVSSPPCPPLRCDGAICSALGGQIFDPGQRPPVFGKPDSLGAYQSDRPAGRRSLSVAQSRGSGRQLHREQRRRTGPECLRHPRRLSTLPRWGSFFGRYSRADRDFLEPPTGNHSWRAGTGRSPETSTRSSGTPTRCRRRSSTSSVSA